MANANAAGITGQEKKFLQLLRGVVIDNDDPKRGGRVQVRIFDLHGPGDTAGPGSYPLTSGDSKDTKYNQVQESELPWAEVMQGIDYIGFNPAPSDGEEEYAQGIDGKGQKSGSKTISRGGKNAGTGYTRIISPGTWVFCVLENGNPNKPIVIGAIAADNEIHKNNDKDVVRTFDSITGHYEEWNDRDGRIIFHHRTGTTITMEKEGEYYLNVVGLRNEYIGKDYSIHKDSNYYSYTEKDDETIIKGNEKRETHGTRDELIKQDHTETREANYTLKTKGNSEETIDGNETIEIKGNQDFKVKGNRDSEITGNDTLKVKMNHKIEVTANQDFEIKGNHTNNTTGIVTIKGTMIMLN